MSLRLVSHAALGGVSVLVAVLVFVDGCRHGEAGKDKQTYASRVNEDSDEAQNSWESESDKLQLHG